MHNRFNRLNFSLDMHNRFYRLGWYRLKEMISPFSLDMHAYMLNQIHRRSSDGIHWNPDAVRMQVNIILTHYCLSRNIELKNRWKVGLPPDARNLMLEEAQGLAEAAKRDLERKIELPVRKFVKAKRRIPKNDQQWEWDQMLEQAKKAAKKQTYE